MNHLHRVAACLLAVSCAMHAVGVGAVTIRLDYSLDIAGSKFFGTGNPQGAAAGAQAKAALDAAAAFYSNILNDTLGSIITPAEFHGSLGGSAKWTWRRTYTDPTTGLQAAELNPSIAVNDFVVMVGARNLGASELGRGGPGAYSWEYNESGRFTSQERTQVDITTSLFNTAVTTRGETSGFARWGGTLAVDSDTNWHFNHTTAPTAGKTDFYSVALHELAHTIGFGASQEWTALVSGTNFVGSQAMDQYTPGGPVPLNSSSDTSHWTPIGIDSTVFGGSTVQQPLMAPSMPSGIRRQLTNLDAGALVDLGWEINLPQPVPGDYNGNGIVDAADYTIWRNTLGSTADLRANGNNTGASAGKIDQADFTFWKQRFGQTSGSGTASLAVVPEPTSVVLLWAMITFAPAGRWARRRLS